MHIHTHRMLALVAVASLFCNAAAADISFTGSNISQDFDSLGTSTVNNVFPATPGVQAAFPGTTGFVGTRLSGTGSSATPLIANDGGGNSGGLYSYGATGNSDRALGALASGSNVMAFGFRMINDSGLTLDSLTVSFTQENWRSSTNVQNIIAASYSFDQTVSPTGFLSAASGFTAVTALDLVGPTPVATNGALNGNDPANQALRSFTFTGLTWTPGQSFFLRWQDVNDAGNDAGLAIDNMNITFTVIPEPGSASLLGLATMLGLAGLRRRK